MKYLFLTYLCFSINLYSQNIFIPDINFKTALLNHNPVIDTNGDGEIQITEAQFFTQTINVSGTASTPGNIIDLEGIEAFMNIVGFEANYNPIETANFTQNTQLRDLFLFETNIDNLNVSNNLLLRSINASNGNFASLDLSNNKQLLIVQITSSDITTINLSGCDNLQFLTLFGNQLTELNLSNNKNLVRLNASINPLSSIDLSNNGILTDVELRSTSINTLDFSHNQDLRQVDIKDNPILSYLNIKNGNNNGIDISGGSFTSNFENLPNLMDVCIDNVNSTLAGFIVKQTGNTINFSEKCFLNIEESLETIINLYPNPVSDVLQIKTNEPIQQLILYNFLGQEVFRQEKENIKEVNVTKLQNGVYILSLKEKNDVVSIFKIIKN